jgi:integrase
VAYVRTVKTASGATAVQIVWSWRKGSRSIEHLGSAHNEVELAALKTAAAARLAAGQTELDLGLSGGVEPGALPIRPGVQRREAQHLDASGVTALLRAAESSRYYPALVLIAAPGLRKGGALALSWDTNIVNLDEGWLKVRKTLGRVDGELVFSQPKTDRSVSRCGARTDSFF